MQLFLGILLLVMAIFLIISVLMQSGKSKRLSGSIAGGAETFFGKTKGRTIDSVLSKLTTVVAILFVLVVIIVYVAFGTTYTEPEIIYTPIEDNANVDETEKPVEGTEETVEGTEEPTDSTEESVEGAEGSEETEETTQGAEVTEDVTEVPTEE